MRRVVVTGYGVVSPIGTGEATFEKALLSGVSGSDLVTAFDASSNKSKIACEVKDFEPLAFFDTKTIKRTSKFMQFAVGAAVMAVKQAKLDKKEDVATYIGTGAGGMDVLDEAYQKYFKRGAKYTSPFAVPSIIPNMAASLVSIHLGTTGPCGAPTSACSSGLYAVSNAFREIRSGVIDIAIAGGSESTMTSFVFSGYEALKVLSTRNDSPQTASRPFDPNRDGFVLGEGAAILVIESLESALKRGVEILGEITNCRVSSDALHVTSPDMTGDSAAKLMKDTINESGLPLEAIDYINAHGTSTGHNDIMEANAINKTFNQNGINIPVTALKSMVGHTLGASGALALVSSLISLKHHKIPPTINTTEVDETCQPLNVYHQNTFFKQRTIHHILINAFGFGGVNACVLLSRYNH